MKTWDVSVTVEEDLPVWPGSPGWRTRSLQSLAEGDEANVSELTFDLHTGTHIDAPLHFVDGGQSVDQIDLDRLIGPAWVADLTSVEGVIRSEDLDRSGIPVDTKRLLLRTRNSARWSSGTFEPDYVALEAGAARWIVESQIELIGIDYLSVQKFDDGPEVHEILLRAGIVVLEGIDLSKIGVGREYELLCLPLKLRDLEAAPARVLLRDQSDDSANG